MRPPYLFDPMTPSSISPAKRVAIALLSPKRRCAGTMSTVVAVPQLAFSKESMSTQHIVNVGSRASFAKRSKNGQGVWAAANLHQIVDQRTRSASAQGPGFNETDRVVIYSKRL